MRNGIFLLTLLLSVIANAENHPWQGLVGTYRTLSMDGAAVDTQDPKWNISFVSPNYSSFSKDLNGDPILAMTVMAYYKHDAKSIYLQWGDALSIGKYSVLGTTQIYMFNGQVRYAPDPHRTITLADRIEVTPLDGQTLKVRMVRSVKELPEWNSDHTAILKHSAD